MEKSAQSEPPSAQVETDDSAKKLARQLDFMGFGGGDGCVPGQAPTASLPEHAKQIQPQVMKSSQLTVSIKSTQPNQPPPQLQQHILSMPMQQTPPHPSLRPLKPESPKGRSGQSASEVKDGTPKKPKQCNYEKDASLKQAKCHSEASYPSSGIEKVMPHDCSTRIQAESFRADESRLDGADVSKERPISPGTLALMCDEQDTVFTAAAAPPNDLTSFSYNTSFQLHHVQGREEIYPELEKIMLTQTCDFLKKMITLGEIKEKRCSSMVRDADSGRQSNVSSNGLGMTD